jgi:hypothetical protein
MDGDDIARLRHVGRVLDGAKRRLFSAWIGITAAGGNVKFSGLQDANKRERS